MAEKLEPAAPRAAALDPAHDGAAGEAVQGGAPVVGATTREAASAAAGRARSATIFYVLGLSIQVLLWLLVFLAIAAAIATGGHLTEFRYVRF